jgi:mannitol-1-phosphate/altronate dehydrogenase
VSLSGNRTFVGIGFGAIQAGLFLYEAFHSGNFRRLVADEVMPGAVKALRDSAGWYAVNVAHRDRVEADRIGPAEIANPADERDRELLISAIAEAEEIADLERFAGARTFLERAFVQESGEALNRWHKGVDVLFTPEGYRAYAVDPLDQMFNPYLGDTVDRVGRDPARKLEWNDRLVGTIRVALRQGVNPRRYAFGTAAAITTVAPTVGAPQRSRQDVLDPLWAPASPDPAEREQVLQAVEEAQARLDIWRNAGCPDLESLFEADPVR